jgi:hypothetical protein
MAFTVDLTEDVGVAMPFDGAGKHFVVQKTVDFSVAANHVANAETMGLFPIPAGVLVEEVIVEVVHLPDTDCDDINIGSYTTAGVAIDATGFGDHFTIYASGTGAYVRDVSGQTYSLVDGTAGFVRATDWALGFLNDDTHELDHGILRFIAICKDLR